MFISYTSVLYLNVIIQDCSFNQSNYLYIYLISWLESFLPLAVDIVLILVGVFNVYHKHLCCKRQRHLISYD